jgi:uncharacterized protein (DUF1778 family)
MKLDLDSVKKDKKLTDENKNQGPKNGFTEYSRNLLHKNLYEKNDIEPVLRDRLNLGKHITVPVFYEEEKLFKAAANASIDEQGRAYSLNDFIRVAVVKAAYEVLGKEEADKLLADQYNLVATDPTTEAERKIEREKRKQDKNAAIRSDAKDYPRSPTKTRKRKSPDELASRGRKSNTKPVTG